MSCAPVLLDLRSLEDQPTLVLEAIAFDLSCCGVKRLRMREMSAIARPLLDLQWSSKQRLSDVEQENEISPSRSVNFMIRREDLTSDLVAAMADEIKTIRQGNRYAGLDVSIRYLGNTMTERLEGEPATCVLDLDFYY